MNLPEQIIDIHPGAGKSQCIAQRSQRIIFDMTTLQPLDICPIISKTLKHFFTGPTLSLKIGSHLCRIFYPDGLAKRVDGTMFLENIFPKPLTES
jgi:hypothetical protein